MPKLLKQLLHRRPFNPIRIVMRSGERYDIADPERVAIGKTIVFLIAPSDRMSRLVKREIELVYQPRPSRTWRQGETTRPR